MNKILIKPFILIVFLLFCALTASAQEQKSTTEKVLKTAGKVTVIVVGETAQAGYEVTKFGMKTIAKPLVVKVVPKAAKFLVKKSLPLGKKLFVTYIKTKIPL